MGKRVLVCGGRNYSDVRAMRLFLNALHGVTPIMTIINGGANGADDLSTLWAEGAGVPVEIYRAEWGKNGRAAGPIRNQRMLDDGKPDIVVAFPGGIGTADMVRRANAASVTVISVTGSPALPPTTRGAE